MIVWTNLALEGGAYYANRDGRILGPMLEEAPGIFVDQNGVKYFPRGEVIGDATGKANLVLHLSGDGIAMLRKSKPGIYCANHRGDVLGPMRPEAPGIVSDQHGSLYAADGTKADHIASGVLHIVLRLNDEDIAALRV